MLVRVRACVVGEWAAEVYVRDPTGLPATPWGGDSSAVAALCKIVACDMNVSSVLRGAGEPRRFVIYKYQLMRSEWSDRHALATH